MKEKETDELAEILWNYNLLHQKVEKAEVILALGSHDTEVAEYASRLFLEGFAPSIIFSGGVGRFTAKWNRPEAEVFADVARSLGVPEDKMILETESTNTAENIRFTKELLQEKGLEFETFILIHKPYMERRAYATFQKEMAGKKVVVTSPPISFKDYLAAAKPKERLINVLVGDTERIRLYGKRGFMAPQEIPEDVWSAFEELVRRGFTSQLVNQQS